VIVSATGLIEVLLLVGTRRMRWYATTFLCSVSCCLACSAASAQTWQEMLSRADSLATGGQADSANEVLETALFRALTQYGQSDTTVEFVRDEGGVSHRYYFPSYAYAESLYRQALSIKGMIVGRADSGCAHILNDLSSLYLQQGDYSQAISGYSGALAIMEKTVGSERIGVAESLHGLAASYHYQGSYAEAETLYKQALAIEEEALGPEHLLVARELSHLSTLYMEEGKYDEVEPLLTRALDIRKRLLGAEHADVAEALDNMGNLYYREGRYSEALEMSNEALAIYEKNLGPDHPDVALSMNNVAGILRSQGRYSEAENLNRRALMVLEKAVGHDHPEVAATLSYLAYLAYVQGEYVEAERLNTEALAIREKILGPDHPDVAWSLNNLASVCRTMGKYAKAEPLYKRALKIRETAFGRGNVDVGTTLNDMSKLYSEEGNYEDATSCLEEALHIWEASFGHEHPYVAIALNNLASLFHDEGKFALAESLYLESVEVLETIYGEEHYKVAKGLSNLGRLYVDEGDYEQGQSVLSRALSISIGSLGPDHPDVAESTVGLGLVALGQGRLAAADSLLDTALRIRTRVFGSDHPAVAEVFEVMARLARLEGKREQALYLALRGFEIRQKVFSENASVLPEKDALEYAQSLRRSLSTAITCFFEAGALDSQAAGAVADAILASKGEVSDQIFERQSMVVEKNDSVATRLYKQLNSAKFQISKLYVEGPRGDISTYSSMADSLVLLAGGLEDKLCRHSGAYARLQDYTHVNTDRVRTALPAEAFLVEFVRYQKVGADYESAIPCFCALVVSREKPPIIVDLGNAGRLDDLLQQYRMHMLRVADQGHLPSQIDLIEYKRIATSIYEALIQPIDDYISGARLLVFGPAGGLNLVSFAGLVDSQGHYLVERVPVHYVSAGRDIIRFAHEEEPGRGLLAIGDPAYDTVGVVTANQSGVSTIPGSPSPYLMRNVRSVCGELGDITVTRLPHTRSEVEYVADQWRSNSSAPVEVYLGEKATEDNLKKKGPGKQVIHIATHGYFFGERCRDRADDRNVGWKNLPVGENPLLLSGLFLAGANLHGKSADSLGIEDGILTAYEVTAMDLSGTDMVVLSACETGLGEIEEGEGVYGLRRAFQIAGANLVVSALWPVPDVVTARMMADLYSSKNDPLPLRIRRMQLKQIDNLRSHGLPDHPFTWGAFVAMGAFETNLR
jgi:tetratricopeptide (TPR) repeat protein/CHAT domain-containing protein